MNVNQQKAGIAALELADAMRKLAEVESARFELPISDVWHHVSMDEWKEARQLVSKRIHKLTPGGRDHRRWTMLGQLIDLADRGSSAVAGGAIIEKEARQTVVEIRARTREMLGLDQRQECHDEWRGPDGRLGHHSFHAWSESDYPGFGYRY